MLKTVLLNKVKKCKNKIL